MSTKENLIKVYEYALNQEQTGMSFFKASLARMGIGAAVSAFKRLIQEEEKHILFLYMNQNSIFYMRPRPLFQIPFRTIHRAFLCAVFFRFDHVLGCVR